MNSLQKIVFLTVVYFIGLVVLGIAVAEYINQPEVGFMIIGAGFIIYSLGGLQYYSMSERERKKG